VLCEPCLPWQKGGHEIPTSTPSCSGMSVACDPCQLPQQTWCILTQSREAKMEIPVCAGPVLVPGFAPGLGGEVT
jgi:hypothetical protein